MPSFAIVFYSLIFDFTTILAAAGLVHQQQHEFCLISVGTSDRPQQIDLKKKEDRIWIILPSSLFPLPSIRYIRYIRYTIRCRTSISASSIEELCELSANRTFSVL